MREFKFKYFFEQDEKIRSKIYNLVELAGGCMLDDFSALTWVIIGKCQYTGLKDKNGIEIYEGDIIKVNGNLYEVWHSGLAFGLIDKNKDFFEYMCQLCGMNGMVYEVIGNIYENPELLEENK